MRDLLAEGLARRILVLDGALGTMLRSRGDDDAVTRAQADAVRRLHDAYLEAGADIIRTNTFSSTSSETARSAARLARRAADRAATVERPRLVAGAVSPAMRTEAYADRVEALVDGGADLILLETVFDADRGATAAAAVREALDLHAPDVPLMISATITRAGCMPSGDDIDAFYARVRGARPYGFGVNCGVGAQAMEAPLATIAGIADAYVSCHPNAGLPDDGGRYPDEPVMMAGTLRAFATRGLLNIVGGCCGTTPAHIRALAAAVAGVPPRMRP